jgi:hypothetical protein
VLHEGVFVFATLPLASDPRAIRAVAMIREAEGWTIVTDEGEAQRAGLQALFRAAWITLSVDSDLQAVGFTAAFAAALAEVEISCNVIAGVHHDHIFVPFELAGPAMDRLHALQSGAAR